MVVHKGLFWRNYFIIKNQNVYILSIYCSDNPSWEKTGPQNLWKWLLLRVFHIVCLLHKEVRNHLCGMSLLCVSKWHIKSFREASVFPLSWTILPSVHCYGGCTLIFSEHPIGRQNDLFPLGLKQFSSYSKYQNISSWLSTGSIIITGWYPTGMRGFYHSILPFFFYNFFHKFFSVLMNIHKEF